MSSTPTAVRRGAFAAALSLLLGLGLVTASPASAQTVHVTNMVGYESADLIEGWIEHTTTHVRATLKVGGSYVIGAGLLVSPQADLPGVGDPTYLSDSLKSGDTFVADVDSDCPPSVTSQSYGGYWIVTLTIERSCFGSPEAIRVQASVGGNHPVYGLQQDVAPGENVWSDPIYASPGNAVAPSIAGTPRVGSALTASPGQWEAGTSLAYQWLVGGAVVAGATGTTYTPTLADVGKVVAVEVTGSMVGFANTTKVKSAAVGPVQPATLTQTSPGKIKGKLKVGSKVKATLGTWNPSGVTAKYQWFAKKAGAKKYTKLSGATKAKLKLGSSLKGASLKVKLVVSAPGYDPVTVTVKRKGTVKG